MPAANSTRAPSFSGKTKDILDFFDDFEQQAESCGLTAAEKCNVVTRYLDRKTQTLWKGTDRWKDGKWDNFKASVLEDYPTPIKLIDSRFEIWNESLLSKGRETLTLLPSSLITTKNFNLLLYPLLALSATDCDRYFWEGLHKNVRWAVLRRIESTDTTYNRSKPIDMDIIIEAARYILSDDVFEKDQNNPVAM
jgi:hypothetical protein